MAEKRASWHLRCTPAMAAGVTDKLWEMSDIVKLVEQARQDSSDNAYGTEADEGEVIHCLFGFPALNDA